MNFKTLKKKQIHIWIANLALIITYFASQLSGGLFLGSTQNLNHISADPFDGAIMPLAFVPDWRKGSYIENRGDLHLDEVGSGDFVSLPDYANIQSDFLSNYTYITVHAGAYMDTHREEESGSHL